MKHTWARYIFIIALALSMFHKNAQAIDIISDSEIENGIYHLVSPIFKVAGGDPSAIKVYIILDPSLNAYVTDGQNIFIHTGLITAFNNPDILKGVVAHELGHIRGGHLISIHDRVNEIMKTLSITNLMGIAAVVGGIAAGGNIEPGAAVMSGGKQFAERNYMQYSRSHETAADKRAVEYLHASGNTLGGLMTLLSEFEKRDSMHSGVINKYAITHPLSKERIQYLHSAFFGEKNGSKTYGSSNEEKRVYSRIVGKLRGFVEPLDKLKNTPQNDLDEFSRKYEAAIVLYRLSRFKDAIDALSILIEQNPNDGYLYQLKAQFLFENGKILESLPFYEKSLSYSSNNSIIKTEYALALANALQFNRSDSEKNAFLKKIIDVLNEVKDSGYKTPYIYRNLAIAYGKLGKLGYSNLMLAEESILLYKYDDVRKFLGLAKKYAGNDEKLKLKIDDMAESLPT